ncbi:unnamed protein product [Meloidogyne enterolobii]|uniref:Uncharacterized protein n=1 Tax=Meloidogyne enterolobii TaxID=390850 RepID=A0ACB1B2R8_MELEN
MLLLSLLIRKVERGKRVRASGCKLHKYPRLLYYQTQYNVGCGKCPEGFLYTCFTCKTRFCNTHHDLLNAFKCGESINGKYTDHKVRDCYANKCFISVDLLKGKTEEVALEKYTKQGCGECPKGAGQCRTCTKNQCNTKDFYQEMRYCWKNDNEVVECSKTANKKCYYAYSYDKKGGGK